MLDFSTTAWFAVQTWPRYEKKVAAELGKKQLEAFLPVVGSRRQWGDRQCVIQLPVFPSYVFVRIPETLEHRRAVLGTNGVKSFVGVRGTGIPIPEWEIKALRLLLTTGISFNLHPFLNIGQRVRIRGSSLDGVEGILLAKNNDCSLVLSIQLIQRSVSIQIAGYHLEAA